MAQLCSFSTCYFNPWLVHCCSCEVRCAVFTLLIKFTCFLCYREGVSADFMAACHFLNDHMENMDNPNDDMVRWTILRKYSMKPKIKK